MSDEISYEFREACKIPAETLSDYGINPEDSPIVVLRKKRGSFTVTPIPVPGGNIMGLVEEQLKRHDLTLEDLQKTIP